MKIVRYFFVGGIAAVIDFSIFFCFAKLLGYNYLLVACVGFVLATVVNYFLSVRFVFRSGVRFTKGAELALVYVFSLIGLGLNQLILFGLVEFVGLEMLLSKVGATGSVFVWNFAARNLIVFRER